MPKPRLRDTWILRKQEAITFAILYVGMTAIWFAFGWLLTHPLKDSWIVHTDESIERWFVEQRTPTLNSLSFIGSMLSDTLVKIVVTAIVALVMLKVWKRWLEPLVVCMSLDPRGTVLHHRHHAGRAPSSRGGPTRHVARRLQLSVRPHCSCRRVLGDHRGAVLAHPQPLDTGVRWSRWE